VDTTEIDGPLIGICSTFGFASDGTTVTSNSTLRFREREEVETDLAECGFEAPDVRDAPDRPGREYVVVARRPM